MSLWFKPQCPVKLYLTSHNINIACLKYDQNNLSPKVTCCCKHIGDHNKAYRPWRHKMDVGSLMGTSIFNEKKMVWDQPISLEQVTYSLSWQGEDGGTHLKIAAREHCQ